MNKFVKMDNKLRASKYQKNNLIEDSILRMNQHLMLLEQYESCSNKFPTIFIFGLPRSGTTLTYQLVAYSLDVGYINNLTARFWLAPLQGIMLSKAVLLDVRDNSFTSDYGKSTHINGPHEFAYFWQHWLKMKSVEDMLKFGDSRKDINWKLLGNVVSGMQGLFGKGMVFKTNFAANFFVEFSQTFNMPFFIYVERNMSDVARSILKARKVYYGNYETWWATYPPDYKKLKKLSYHEQIAGQVYSLKRTYEEQLKRVDNDLIMRINYVDLCKSPDNFVKSVSKRIKYLYDFTVGIINTPPAKFKNTGGKRLYTIEEKLVISALKKYL